MFVSKRQPPHEAPVDGGRRLDAQAPRRTPERRGVGERRVPGRAGGLGHVEDVDALEGQVVGRGAFRSVGPHAEHAHVEAPVLGQRARRPRDPHVARGRALAEDGQRDLPVLGGPRPGPNRDDVVGRGEPPLRVERAGLVGVDDGQDVGRGPLRARVVGRGVERRVPVAAQALEALLGRDAHRPRLVLHERPRRLALPAGGAGRRVVEHLRRAAGALPGHGASSRRGGAPLLLERTIRRARPGCAGRQVRPSRSPALSSATRAP